MTTGNNGAKLSLYFDKNLWKELDLQACKLSMSANDFVRFAVKKYIDQEAVEEIEKLQVLNARMFKYLADRLSDLELLSSIAKKEFDGKDALVSYEESLQRVKGFNKKIVEDILEETL